jgi:hypothetical protein
MWGCDPRMPQQESTTCVDVRTRPEAFRGCGDATRGCHNRSRRLVWMLGHDLRLFEDVRPQSEAIRGCGDATRGCYDRS